MDHNVAVWADRTHVSNGIHHMFTANLGEFLQMVNMDEPLSDSIIHTSEVKTANEARRTIVSKTCCTSCGIPLVGINRDPLNRALDIGLVPSYFIGEDRTRWKISAYLNDAFQPHEIICK